LVWHLTLPVQNGIVVTGNNNIGYELARLMTTFCGVERMGTLFLPSRNPINPTFNQ